MVYEIDFIPATSPAAKKIRPARPVWMDVMNGSGLYPVFDVKKGAGRNGRYTFPDDEPNAYGGGFKRNEWKVDRDGVLIGTAGHLHPGGLYTDLHVRRRGARIRAARCGSRPSAASRRRCRSQAPRGRGNKAHLFRSKAKYYEPAGAVSWDVSMTATRPDWKVKVKKGDVLTTNATYDTKRAAWWESMGIMLVWMVDGGRGRDPFKTRVDYPGKVTHGHLPENNNHGGRRTGLPDARKLPDGPVNPGTIDVLDFRYALGDLSLSGSSGRPPVVRAGQSLSFRNADDPRADLSLPDLLQAPLQPLHRHRLPDRRRPGAVRVGHARQRSPGHGTARVQDAARAGPGHLHLLLPDPPLHARSVPGQEVAAPRRYPSRP